MTRQKDTFAYFREFFNIEILKQHRKGAGKIIIMTRRNLGTKLGISQSTMLTSGQKRGKLGTT